MHVSVMWASLTFQNGKRF